MQISSEYIY